jgi:hypothetical protein
MARDIEEFLRRAAERRKQNQQGGGKPPVARPVSPPPRKPITERSVVVPEVVTPLPSQQPRPLPSETPTYIGNESVADHVRRHIDVTDVTEHASHLAEVIENADERMEAHLDKVFDHDVGRLGTGQGTTDELNRDVASNAIAEDLLELFQSPKSIRQSILVAEILKRPNFDD